MYILFFCCCSASSGVIYDPRVCSLCNTVMGYTLFCKFLVVVIVVISGYI